MISVAAASEVSTLQLALGLGMRLPLTGAEIPRARVCQRAAEGGGKLRGGGKHTVNSAKNPSPKTFLDPPPTIRFPPPPFLATLCHFP